MKKSGEGALVMVRKELAYQKEEKEKLAAELVIAREEVAFQKEEKGKRAAELGIANKILVFQDEEKGKRAAELGIANKELAFQDEEKEKRADELIIANIELAFQDEEKEKRAIELGIANLELAFQDEEKEKRAAELIIANLELVFQNDEKEKRAIELGIANLELAFQDEEKEKRAAELIIANKELVFQNAEKEKRAAELIIANAELVFQNDEKEKRAAELSIANKELLFQNEEKEKRAAELIIANKELVFQNDEKEKRAAELIIANKELAFQNDEKEKRAEELSIANKELAFQNDEKEKRANELIIANKELAFQNDEKEKRAAELFIANEELLFQTGEKEKRAAELVIADIELDFQNKEKEKREIANKELEEAKSKAESATQIAEEAVKAKQQFLSNMSHEIRTPMNAIIGFTKVMLKTDLSEKQEEYLTAIKVSGDALIVLINDILDLAKVEAGKMSFEKTPFKLAASISSMLHLFETKVQEKNLKLVKEYDSNIPDVLVGDPVRLHQIILNLVSNAVKFTTNGIITVSVRQIENIAQDIVSIKFAVTDTGIGIEENTLDRIFENFQQASSGTSRLFGGTGLGLAIVKQLVEQQGGTISVKSKIDEGSTFSFVLNFQKTKAEAELERGVVELDTEIKNLKVLVVEDIALNQLLMKTFLDDFGFECDIAPNGRVAIEKLSKNAAGSTKPYDIILMDLQMPEMNGFEATEYIRNKMSSKIPIIALTADVTTVDLAKCKAVGMNDYIAKPIDERVLYTKIAEFVKKATAEIAGIDGHNEDSLCTGPFEIITDGLTAQLKCINLDSLLRRTKANPRLMTEMILLYLEQTPPLVSAMKQSFHNKNWELLQSAVHKMIPSFSIMGISTDFEDAAKKVQEWARMSARNESGIDNKNESGNTPFIAGRLPAPEISDLVLQLEKVCTRACKELELELITIKNNSDGSPK
ncbi:MAG: ATP-binding protein [Bacteroidota bacterium]|nr:ATP-binding protein [Bacteroidota bacterium]